MVLVPLRAISFKRWTTVQAFAVQGINKVVKRFTMVLSGTQQVCNRAHLLANTNNLYELVHLVAKWNHSHKTILVHFKSFFQNIQQGPHHFYIEGTSPPPSPSFTPPWGCMSWHVVLFIIHSRFKTQNYSAIFGTSHIWDKTIIRYNSANQLNYLLMNNLCETCIPYIPLSTCTYSSKDEKVYWKFFWPDKLQPCPQQIADHIDSKTGSKAHDYSRY